MILSKKLIIAVMLALGIQCNVGAFFNEPQDQKSLILTFAQDLHNQNSTQAQTVAKWLDTQAINESSYCQAVVDIITNYNLTEKSKLELLSEIIEKQKRDSRNKKKYALGSFVEDVCFGVIATGIIGVCIWATIEDIKNPRPIICVEPPVIRVKCKYKQPTLWYNSPWHTTFHLHC